MPAKAKQTKKQPKPQAKRQGKKPRTANNGGAPPYVRVIHQRTASAGNARPIFLGMALPEQYPKRRLPSACMSRTAVLTLKDTLTLQTSPTYKDTMGYGSSYLALFGQPGRIAMTRTTRTISRSKEMTDMGVAPSYTLHFASPSNRDISRWHVAMGSSLTVDNMPEWEPRQKWNPVYGVPHMESAGLPHGKQMPTGRAGGDDWVFLNEGTKLYLTHAPTWDTPSGTHDWAGQVDFDVYYAADEVAPIKFHTINATVAGGSMTYEWTAPHTGHYCVELTKMRQTGGPNTPYYTFYSLAVFVSYDIGDAQSGTLDLWGIINHRTTEQSPELANAGRVVACSALVTNTTAEMFKQGTITAARIHDKDPWSVSDDDLDGFNEKYSDRAALGCYTFLEITEQMEEYRDSATIAEAYRGLRYEIQPPGPVHLMRIEAPLTAPNIFRIALVSTLEYRSDSQRDPLGTAQGNVLDLQAARRLLNSRPEWFYHNPDHMARIYRLLGAMGRGVKRYGPMAAKVAGMLNPSNAAAYNLLASGLGALNLG